MHCPWLCLKVLLGKCSKHPACRKEGRQSASTWIFPSRKYYLTSAQDHDVLMAACIGPVIDKSVRSLAHSSHGISTSSQGGQGTLARQSHLATLVLCSRNANLTASSQRKCHLGACLATGSVETTKWSSMVAGESSMISLHQQVGSGELHLSSLTLTESLMMSLWSICAILNRCLHSSTVISVYLISSEPLPTKFLM